MAKSNIQSDAYRHFGSYERLRRAILDEPDHDRMNRTLAYWVLPADRRLPVVFLNRQLSNIVSLSLDELLETPGVGEKKVGGLLTLLRRALRSTEKEADFGLEKAADRRRRTPKSGTKFDPTLVSEELWSQWRLTVKQAGFENYTLGELASTLQSLPTVIWQAQLSDYTNLTLEEIRNLKTHGEKRVHTILEIFANIHEAVSTSTLEDYLEIQLVQRRLANISTWIIKTLEKGQAPSASELEQYIAVPLIKQIEIDLGKQIASVAESRVCSLSNSVPVREHAKKMNVTRARVYQLLEECSKAIQVRWPTGRWLLAPLGSLIVLEQDVETLDQYRSICELFFPKESKVEEVKEMAV